MKRNHCIHLKLLLELRYASEIKALSKARIRKHYSPFFMQKKITNEHYVTILREFVSTQLALQDRQGIDWFMHDGA